MSRSYSYRTALQEAVLFTSSDGDAERVIQMLLDHGALVNAYDDEGWTPLHECGANDHYDIALMLLYHGANIEGRPPPLDPACSSNPVLFNPRKSSYTPLLLAGIWQNRRRERFMRLFLIHKANVYARTDTGETLLHLYASEGDIALAMMLIDAGCDVNVKDQSNNDTPLHKAASTGQLTIIRALLAKGAIVRGHKNVAGRDALQEAREFGQAEAMAMLLSESTRNSPETKYRMSNTLIEDPSISDYELQAPSRGYTNQVDDLDQQVLWTESDIEASRGGQGRISNDHRPSDPSPPRSVARSSYGTTIPISEGQRRRNLVMERRLFEHYAILKRFLAQSLRNEKDNTRPNRATDKLLRLSPVQFQDLSTDVYDELLRKLSSAGH